jgi:hypothetical protein
MFYSMWINLFLHSSEVCKFGIFEDDPSIMCSWIQLTMQHWVQLTHLSRPHDCVPCVAFTVTVTFARSQRIPWIYRRIYHPQEHIKFNGLGKIYWVYSELYFIIGLLGCIKCLRSQIIFLCPNYPSLKIAWTHCWNHLLQAYYISLSVKLPLCNKHLRQTADIHLQLIPFDNFVVSG